LPCFYDGNISVGPFRSKAVTWTVEVKICRVICFSFLKQMVMAMRAWGAGKERKGALREGKTTESWYHHSSVATELWYGLKVGLGDVEA
jgi:hypothetical protein